MILNIFIRLSGNHSLLSSDLILAACTFPFCISLWLFWILTLASACLQLSSMFVVLFLFFVFVSWPVGLFPFYPIEVLISAVAFEISCRKPSAKTVACIFLASDKPAPSFCSNILFFPLFYSISYCCCASFSWRSLLESWPISTTSRWVNSSPTDSNQGEKTADHHPVSLVRIRFEGLGPSVWLGFIFLHVCAHFLPHTKDLRLFTAFGKALMVTLGRLFSLSAQLLLVVYLCRLQSLLEDNC